MRKRNLVSVLMLILSFIFIISCEPEYPPSIYNPSELGEPTPVIDSIVPKEGSYEGVGKIKIFGKNFSTVKEKNIVTYNGNRGDVLEASEDSLYVQNAVVIKDPAVNFLDSVRVVVSVIGAFLPGKYLYRLERAAILYGEFDKTRRPHVVTCDSAENIYVACEDKKIYKVTPDGDQTVYSNTGISIMTGMKIGPGNYLYLSRKHKKIYRVPPGGGSKEEFTQLSGRVNDLDFDENRIMYAAGVGDSIYSIRSDGSFFGSAEYVDFTIASVRVFDGYVYVAGKYEGSDALIAREGIWRNKILSGNGDLGERELVFDWASYVGEFGQSINSITFDSDGKLYIGASALYSSNAYLGGDAITVLNLEDMTAEPLYSAILYAPSTSLCWGNGNFLYQARLTESPDLENAPDICVIRIWVDATSAPYYGRE